MTTQPVPLNSGYVYAPYVPAAVSPNSHKSKSPENVYLEMETSPTPVLPLVTMPAQDYRADLSEWFRPLVSKDAYVAGGCFKQFLTGQPIRDIDIWFSSEAAHSAMVQKMKKNPNYTIAYETTRSVGFQHNTESILLDLVGMRFGTPIEILSGFDFTVCQMAYYVDAAGVPTLAYHPTFLDDLNKKLLVMDPAVQSGLVPNFVFNRMVKYCRDYGFTPSLELKQWMFDKLTSMTYSPVAPLDLFNRY